MKKERIITTVSAVMCLILFALMLTLSGIYMAKSRGINIGGNGTVSEDVLSELKYGKSLLDDGFDLDCILPSAIAYKTESDGKVYGIMCESSEILSLCNFFSAVVSGIFGEEYECRVAESEDFLSALESDNFIYFSFKSDFNDYIISAFFGGSIPTGSQSGERITLSEMVITFEAENNYFIPTAYTKNVGGEYFSLSAVEESGRLKIEVSDFNTWLTGTSSAECEFAIESDERLSASQLIFEENIKTAAISLTQTDPSVDTELYLSLFDYNKNKLNTYTEGDDTNVYIEGHGILRISSDGVEYNANDGGGIPLYAIAGYTSSGSYSVYEDIAACCRICEKICETGYSGGLRLEIGEIYYSSGKLIIDFICLYDNCVIYSNGEPLSAISFEIENNYITHAEISIYSCAAGAETINLTQLSALPYIVDDGKKYENGRMSIGYDLTGFGEVLCGEWIYEVK